MGILTLLLFKRLQSEELSEDNLIDMNGKHSHERKDGYIAEKRMQVRNCTFMEFSEIVHHIERGRDKMLEADSKLESSMTICQGIERCFIIVISYRTERRRQPLFKLPLIGFCFCFFTQKSTERKRKGGGG